MARKDLRPTVAYLRTSSAANTGADKDSGKRQRATIEAFARSAGFAILDSYYDEAVSGADPVTSRSGFAAMMERIASDGVRVIIVETANRFARDLIVQETGSRCSRSRASSGLRPTSPMNSTARTSSAKR